MCSGRHPTSECLTALNSCESCTMPKLWHKGCPEQWRRTPLPPHRLIETLLLMCQDDFQKAPAKMKLAPMQRTASSPASPSSAPAAANNASKQSRTLDKLYGSLHDTNGAHYDHYRRHNKTSCPGRVHTNQATTQKQRRAIPPSLRHVEGHNKPTTVSLNMTLREFVASD